MNIGTAIRRGKLSRILMSVVLSTGILVGVTTASSTTAGAIGTTHKFALPLKNLVGGTAPAARLQIVCNDATGQTTISLTNVQIIQSDHLTPWPQGDPWVSATTGYYVVIDTNDAQIRLDQPLTQNSSNGLYQYKLKTGIPTWECYTGQTWFVGDYFTFSLYMTGSMT